MTDPETTFDRLKRSLEQAAAHARGEDVPGLVEHAPDRLYDVREDVPSDDETADTAQPPLG